MKALSQITSNAALIDSALHAQNHPLASRGMTARGRGPLLPAHLVGAEALLGVVGELVADVDQVVVGVDVVQAVGLGLAGRLAHVLAIAEQAVEVELVGVLAVGGQAGVTADESEERRSENWKTEMIHYVHCSCRQSAGLSIDCNIWCS